ncbi:MAG TPA: hypothetical protein DGT21_15845 [Armatimonadetes bacterium]|jgi:hypothetical protein|nr:hypothetical protein [Armatimonadota bacterium]
MAQEAPRTLELTWHSRSGFEQCTREIGVELAREGLRLAASVLLQDERGMTCIRNTEALSDDVRARKDFVLCKSDLVDGRLYFYTNPRPASPEDAPMTVLVNGMRLRPVKALPSTGWSFVRTLGVGLQEGTNSFVFSGGRQLLIENSMWPNRSARSTDGGETWDFDALGEQGMNDGEYLVRLRLERYPERAVVASPPLDLATMVCGDGPCSHTVAARIKLTATTDEPRGTALALEARTSADGCEWGRWAPAAEINKLGAAPRFLQWRAVLSSSDGDATPILKAVSLSASVAGELPADVTVIEKTAVEQTVSSFRFAYQRPYERLTRLAKQYKLKQVISGAESDLERFVAVRNWCRYSAEKGWDMGRTDWCPPWDALVILEMNKDPRALCMCTHYSTLFVQTALALGYTARHVILDHHCVAEAWCDDLGKWVLMDTGCSHDPARNCHFEHDGEPLNALEIRRLWQARRIAEIGVIYPKRRKTTGDKLVAAEQCDFTNYRRFGIPFRNNHLQTPFPGEVQHGHGEYYCDAYLWWEDKAVPTQSPEYGFTSCREGDFYPTLNQTEITLLATETGGVLRVELRTHTPNFAAFRLRVDGKRWQRTDAKWAWRLKAGCNALEACAVNAFGVEGRVSRVVVEFSPDSD